MNQATLYKEHAQCHCGNISADAWFQQPVSNYIPRACDCDFCVKHGAAYISDPQGRLAVRIANQADTSVYKQGSGLVDLLICSVCGVLVAVTYECKGRLIGGLNSRTLQNRDHLQPPCAASPKLLPDDEKISRWETIWFPEVTIEPEQSSQR